MISQYSASNLYLIYKNELLFNSRLSINSKTAGLI